MSKLIAILVTMKQRKRLIVRNVISHCYQRTTGGVVIFYNISDYLVFFTIFCTTARKYKVKILSLCLMADHIHICISEERKGELSAFVREYSKLFSRVHNRTCHTQGNLFESPFGSAPKFGDKKARANLIYIGNNAPERRLCRNAEEYRWNFLAYAVCTHPFSKSFSAKDSSPIFRNIRKVVTTLLIILLPSVSLILMRICWRRCTRTPEANTISTKYSSENRTHTMQVCLLCY